MTTEEKGRVVEQTALWQFTRINIRQLPAQTLYREFIIFFTTRSWFTPWCIALLVLPPCPAGRGGRGGGEGADIVRTPVQYCMGTGMVPNIDATLHLGVSLSNSEKSGIYRTGDIRHHPHIFPSGPVMTYCISSCPLPHCLPFAPSFREAGIW